MALAPYTTDGDLALDPTLLGDDPEIEATMRRAGFELSVQDARSQHPGIWLPTADIGGQQLVIPIDLIVPEAAAIDRRGRRAARLGPHGARAARRAVGLEAVLIDHDTMTVEAIEPSDGRSIDVEVAGVGGLLVAKVHKINDRLVTGRPDRLIDKDAADIFRIMQTASPRQVGTTLASLRHSALAGQVTDTVLRHLAVLFGRRAGEGVGMAQRALRTAVPEEQVSALCISFTERLVAAVGH